MNNNCPTEHDLHCTHSCLRCCFLAFIQFTYYKNFFAFFPLEMLLCSVLFSLQIFRDLPDIFFCYWKNIFQIFFSVTDFKLMVVREHALYDLSSLRFARTGVMVQNMEYLDTYFVCVSLKMPHSCGTPYRSHTATGCFVSSAFYWISITCSVSYWGKGVKLSDHSVYFS